MRVGVRIAVAGTTDEWSVPREEQEADNEPNADIDPATTHIM